jgi:iron complex transport system ATP-binding protein
MNTGHIFLSQRVVAGYDKKIIIDGVDLQIPHGEISAIIGANACGKSTLLKTMSRLIKPAAGAVTLNGASVHKMNSKRLAAILGLLPQAPVVPEGITVSDLVGRGRFPHQKLLSGWSAADYEAVAEALDSMGITALADADIDELSGGQRQRVWIAMALAQKTDILFLDEPTTYLDIAYQIEILDLLYELNRKYGTTIVMVLHDINLAARYAKRLFAMKAGRLYRDGAPSELIDEGFMKEVFGLDCLVINDPFSNTPFVIPKGRRGGTA